MVSKTHIIVTGTCAFILLLLGIGGPFLVNHLIVTSAGDEAKMTSDNYELWGQIPGQIGAEVIRNNTFYNLMNEKDVIFKGANPIFEESTAYSYWEKHNFTNPVFSQNGDTVDFGFYQFFEPAYNTTGDELLTTINVGAMGAWLQMKHASFDQICLQAMGELFFSLKEQIGGSVLGIGVIATIFPNADKTIERLKQITPALTDEQIDSIVNDPAYGLNAETNFPWVMMSYQLNSSKNVEERPSGEGTFTFLQNYFGISYDQLDAIKNLIYNGAGGTAFGVKTLYPTLIQGKGVYSAAVNGAYCKVYKDFPCDENLLAAAQWTVQGVTYDTPKILGYDLPQIDSIGSVNATVIGYPELRYYYKQAFKNTESPYFVDDGEAFSDLFEDKDYWVGWGLEAMKTLPGDEYVTTPHALLNCGNLRTLINYGEQFDESGEPYNDSEYMVDFQKKLNVDTTEKAYFFWNYMKYLTFEFAEMMLQGGSQANAAAGQLAGQGLAQSYEIIQDKLLSYIIAKTLVKLLGSYSCIDLLSLSPFDKTIATTACTEVFKTNDNLTFDNYLTIMQVCTNQNPEQRDLFLSQLGIEEDDLTNFCDSKEQDSIGGTYTQIQQELAKYYQCKYKTYCTSAELAILQWRDSTITKTQPEIMSGVFRPALSFSDWFPEVLSKPIEFGWFMEDYYDVLTQYGDDIFQPTLEQSKELLTYDKLFSGTIMAAAFVWGTSNDGELSSQIEKQLYWTNNDQLLTYMRYISIQISFGGFLQTRTVSELLYGYADPFVTDLKNENPQLGGDPSIDNIVSLSDLNMTSPEEANKLEWQQGMYTGEGNLDQLRMYTQVSGSDHIRVVTPYFDGESVQTYLRNPYREDIKIYGNDGSSSNPNQQKDQINPIYITTIYNAKNLTQTGKVEYEGLKTYRYQFSGYDFANCTTNPSNCPFWSDGPNGLQNMTSVMGAPIFNSQSHFYQGDEALINNMTITKWGYPQYPNKWDETYLDTEIYSGVTLGVVFNLQINYEMQPDLLFPIDFNRYLPIYYMYRGSNFTSDQISDQFGSLKTALGFKLGLMIGGIAFGVILIGLFIFLIVKYRKQPTEQEETELDEQEGLQTKLVKGENNGVNPNFSTKVTDYTS